MARKGLQRRAQQSPVSTLLTLLVGLSVGLAIALAIRAASPGPGVTTIVSLIALFVLVLGVFALAASYLSTRQRSELELRATSREALRAREEAVSASKAKSDFLATMSHEIRTPLSGILSYADLLADEPLTPTQARYAERIQVAGHSLLTVIDDILDFSRIEAGEIALRPQPFSLPSLIDNVASIISAVAEKKGVSVRSFTAPDLPRTVVGDEARLRQVLLNLLNNAVKFTNEGHVALRVERLANGPDSDRIRFAVEDTGIGIPKEKQGLLFRRFSQIDGSVAREFGGSGLGLAISRQLVELMGGRIEVESEAGQGSTFSFAVALPEGRLVDEEQEGEGEQTAADHRILLVEDLEENRDVARIILERRGYTVDCAGNGTEAVEAVQRTFYSVVLMDLQMPKMDGVTATRAIRSLDPPAGDVPIVAMTANVLSTQIRLCREAGMNDHLGKPFSRSALLAKIEKWQSARPAPASAPSPEPDSDDTPEEEVLDAEALAELIALMGEEWTRQSAERLRERIERTLANREPAPEEFEAIARDAHKIVSQAAQLGFVQLSRRYRELEHACLERRDVAERLLRARAAASAAAGQLMTLAGNDPKQPERGSPPRTPDAQPGTRTRPS